MSRKKILSTRLDPLCRRWTPSRIDILQHAYMLKMDPERRVGQKMKIQTRPFFFSRKPRMLTRNPRAIVLNKVNRLKVCQLVPVSLPNQGLLELRHNPFNEIGNHSRTQFICFFEKTTRQQCKSHRPTQSASPFRVQEKLIVEMSNQISQLHFSQLVREWTKQDDAVIYGSTLLQRASFLQSTGDWLYRPKRAT